MINMLIICRFHQGLDHLVHQGLGLRLHLAGQLIRHGLDLNQQRRV
jgi:hypothetical protein